jgi:hypothetical protein
MAWRDRVVAAGEAPSNASNPLNIMNRVYKIARSEWGYRIGNPLTGIARPKPRIPREVFLNAKDPGRIEQFL